MVSEARGRVGSLDHSVVPAMDLWRAERFYTETLDGAMFHKVGITFEWASGAKGTGNFGTFVKLGAHHLGVFLQKRTPVYPASAPDEAYPCWGLAVAADRFDAMVARVAATGVPLGPVREARYGDTWRRGVRCLDSEGNGLELVAVDGAPASGPSVVGLSHLRLEAVDPVASAAFYERYLGLSVVDAGPAAAALALPNGQHLLFHRVEALGPASVGPYTGRHFAFEVTHAAFEAIVERLRADGIPESDTTLDRTPDERETYFYDPDHYWLQITTEASVKVAEKYPLLLRYQSVAPALAHVGGKAG